MYAFVFYTIGVRSVLIYNPERTRIFKTLNSNQKRVSGCDFNLRFQSLLCLCVPRKNLSSENKIFNFYTEKKKL